MAREGSNYPSRSCKGPNEPKGSKLNQNKRRKKKSSLQQEHEAGAQLISPYVLSTHHPPSPYALRYRALWTSFTGTEATSRFPPDSRRPPPAGGCVHSGRGLGFALVTSIAPRTTGSAVVRMGRNGFHATETKKEAGTGTGADENNRFRTFVLFAIYTNKDKVVSRLFPRKCTKFWDT